MHPTLCCIEGARITGKRSAQRARCVMAQVECDAQSHGCGPNAGTIDGILVLLGFGMKKGFWTPLKTLTVEPGIPGVCCYFAVFSVYHDIGCLAAHPALVGPLSRLSFVRIPLFSEKITMGARSGQSEHQHVLLYEIDQQQVWCDMALPHAPASAHGQVPLHQGAQPQSVQAEQHPSVERAKLNAEPHGIFHFFFHTTNETARPLHTKIGRAG